MTTTSADPTPIFIDARQMYEAAIQRVEAGDIRDAADKAWCAAKRATDALILARTGQLPANTSQALLRLTMDDPGTRDPMRRYFTYKDILHGDCFYTGLCEPVDAIDGIIRETEAFIRDAETLARS